MSSDSEYNPSLDDAMIRSLGNVDYSRGLRERAKQAAERAYTDALKSRDPYYQDFGLALGEGLKRKYKSKYGNKLTKQQLYSKIYYKLRGKGLSKEDLAYYRGKKAQLIGTMAPPIQDHFRTLEENRLKRLQKLRDGKAIEPAAPPKPKRVMDEAKKLEMKNRSVAYWAELRADPAKMEAYKLKGKLGKYKRQLKKENPFLTKPELDEMVARYERNLQAQGGTISKPSCATTTSTTPKGGLLTARGTLVSPKGGVLGAVATAAIPIAMEGLKWVVKKIGRKISGKGLDILPFTAAPRSANKFWPAAHLAARDAVANLAPDQREEITDYMKKHLAELADIEDTDDDNHPPTNYDVLLPILRKSAILMCIKNPDFSDLKNLPGAQEPVGSGVMTSILSILKAPATGILLREGGRNVIPVAKRLLKGLLVSKLIKKHPKLEQFLLKSVKALDSAEPIVNEILHEPPPPKKPSDKSDKTDKAAKPEAVPPAIPSRTPPPAIPARTPPPAIPDREPDTATISGTGAGPTTADSARASRTSGLVFSLAQSNGMVEVSSI
jgi:hypothetical protein